MNKKIFFVALLVAFALTNFVSATQVIIPQYTCGIGMNYTCVARDVVILNASSDLSHWQILYNQFALNSTGANDNRSEIYYADNTGFRQRLENDYALKCASCTLSSTVDDTKTFLSGFINSGNNKVYAMYSIFPSGTQTPTGTNNVARLITFDLSSLTVATLQTYQANGATVTMQGVAITQPNTTHFDVAYQLIVAGTQVGNIQEWAFSTGLSGRSVSQSATTRYIHSMFYNGSFLLLGYSQDTTQEYYLSVNYTDFTQITDHSIITASGIQYGGDVFVNSTLYYSDRDGNKEIYLVKLNGLNDTRMTSTAANETIGNTIQTPDSTVIVSYLSSSISSNFTVLNTFCPLTTGALGSNCIGFNGGSNFCNIGFAWNGTLCVPLPGFFNPYTSASLLVYDRACAGFLVGFTPGVYLTCQFGSPIDLQNWIFFDFKINGHYALPPGYNTSQFASNNTILANATCKISNPDGSNPYFLNPVTDFANPTSTQPNAPLWGINVDNNAIAKGHQQTLVTCSADPNLFPQTTLTAFFFTINTWTDLSSFSFAGGYGGNLIDTSILNQTPINWVEKLGTTPHYSNTPPTQYGQAGTTQCFFGLSSPNTPTIFIPMTYSSTNQNGNNYLTTMTHSVSQLPLLPAGNYLASSQCSVNSFGVDSLSRLPSLTVQKNFQIIDQCSIQGYFNSTLSLSIANKGGNLQNSFSTGENVYLSAFYQAQTNRGQTPWNSASCQANVFLNGNPFVTNQHLTPNGNGLYSGYLQANAAFNGGDPQQGVGLNVGGQNLVGGNYTTTISCTNIDTSSCVLPQTTSGAFTYNTTDTCAGTSSACTLNGCNACPSQLLTCENNATFNITQACISRSCVSTNTATSSICQNNQLYGISAMTNPSSIACGDDSTVVITSLLKNGNAVPPSSIGDLTCTLSVAPQVMVGQPADAATPLLFTVPIVGGQPNIQFALKGKLGSYQYNFCGSSFRATMTCLSSAFTSPKVSDTAFYMGAQGLDCKITEGQSTFIVHDAQCVADITGNDLDKPNYCSAGTVVASSTVCGCPTGLSVNESTSLCDGNAAVPQGINLFTTWVFSPLGVLEIVFLGFPLLALLYFIFRRKTVIKQQLP